MWTIGKLAEKAKVTQRTIRYYEELELLKPLQRGENRFRYYDERHAARLETIKALKEDGFGLKDISLAVSPIFDSAGHCIPSGRDISEQIQSALDKIRVRVEKAPPEKRELILKGIADIKPVLEKCTGPRA